MEFLIHLFICIVSHLRGAQDQIKIYLTTNISDYHLLKKGRADFIALWFTSLKRSMLYFFLLWHRLAINRPVITLQTEEPKKFRYLMPVVA
jgi:hypothetical protein